MGWSPNHNPIREKYSPRMTAAEKRHASFVAQQVCYGCGASPVQAHHTLLKFIGKRSRREHHYLLPVCFRCHSDIHDRFGNEAKWLESVDREASEAIEYMRYLHIAREECDG